MHSESLKSLAKLRPWRAETDCDEAGLASLMAELSQEIKLHGGRSGAWILLEGPMGAGKSTAARLLIGKMGASVPVAGSPTFALAHEFEHPEGFSILHLDLYRLETWQEAEATGIPAYFWERPGSIVLVEWSARYPELIENLVGDSRVPLWWVALEPTDSPERRHVRILKR